ncbi:hypothetical protein [Novosphingobium mathurense]|uniref:Uncharacterized protein n=1 Tax=Novosphingobium mathurense TaxID=428990 RepID=A0A1U6IHM8_9SPHN|nr:hypothetical protein [Novosphingobium mathurense]SLK07499.1 hypothetical protein SAMN06295987_106267 [Novosphingobium mathurense]
MGPLSGQADDAGEPCGLIPGNFLSCRPRARDDEVWPQVYKALPTDQIRKAGAQLGIDDPQLLVTLRHLLAGLFLDQLRSIAGDPARADLQTRRRQLQKISALISALETEYGNALPDIMTDLDEAAWHGPVQWGPSQFASDYADLLSDTQVIKQICHDILASPAFNPRRNSGRGPTNLPARLPGRPGSRAREALAYRLARLFHTATGRPPTTSGSQDTAFQKFAAISCAMFVSGYRDLGKPFGPFAPPSRRDLKAVCARYK